VFAAVVKKIVVEQIFLKTLIVLKRSLGQSATIGKTNVLD
jgi:hypothetical protein